jgi:putative SOS response-associated peptidase YedK
MCGRFTRYLSWSEIVRLYRLTAPAEVGRNDAPAYNVAPTDPVPFITAGEDGRAEGRYARPWKATSALAGNVDLATENLPANLSLLPVRAYLSALSGGSNAGRRR